MDWYLIASLILNFGLILIVVGQRQELRLLRDTNENLLSAEISDELRSTVKKKIDKIGDVKTVKFLRDKKGMSMMAAKQLVDSVKE